MCVHARPSTCIVSCDVFARIYFCLFLFSALLNFVLNFPFCLLFSLFPYSLFPFPFSLFPFPCSLFRGDREEGEKAAY